MNEKDIKAGSGITQGCCYSVHNTVEAVYRITISISIAKAFEA